MRRRHQSGLHGTVKELSKHAFFDHACEQTLFVRAFNFVCCRYTPSKELKELASEAGLFAHELWSMQNDEEVLHAIKAKEAKEFATRELRKVEEDNSEDDSSEDEDDDNSEDEDDSDDEDEDDGDDEDDNNVEDDDGEEDHDKRRKRLEREHVLAVSAAIHGREAAKSEKAARKAEEDNDEDDDDGNDEDDGDGDDDDVEVAEAPEHEAAAAQEAASKAAAAAAAAAQETDAEAKNPALQGPEVGDNPTLKPPQQLQPKPTQRSELQGPEIDENPTKSPSAELKATEPCGAARAETTPELRARALRGFGITPPCAQPLATDFSALLRKVKVQDGADGEAQEAPTAKEAVAKEAKATAASINIGGPEPTQRPNPTQRPKLHGPEIDDNPTPRIPRQDRRYGNSALSKATEPPAELLATEPSAEQATKPSATDPCAKQATESRERSAEPSAELLATEPPSAELQATEPSTEQATDLAVAANEAGAVAFASLASKEAATQEAEVIELSEEEPDDDARMQKVLGNSCSFKGWLLSRLHVAQTPEIGVDNFVLATLQGGLLVVNHGLECGMQLCIKVALHILTQSQCNANCIVQCTLYSVQCTLLCSVQCTPSCGV